MSSAHGLQYEHRSGGLIIRLLDRGILEKKAETIQAFAELIKKHDARALLVDFRRLPGKLGFLDRYEMGEAAAKFLPRIALAVLILPEQLDQGRIGLTVAANRGAHIELFLDESTAETWFTKNTRAEATG